MVLYIVIINEADNDSQEQKKDDRGKVSRACLVVRMGMCDCINPPSAYSGAKHLRRSEAVM